MNREDQAALLRAWWRWAAGRPLDNQTYLDFVDEVVRWDSRYQSVHVFEVLDLLVNAEPERRSA